MVSCFTLAIACAGFLAVSLMGGFITIMVGISVPTKYTIDLREYVTNATCFIDQFGTISERISAIAAEQPRWTWTAAVRINASGLPADVLFAAVGQPSKSIDATPAVFASASEARNAPDRPRLNEPIRCAVPPAGRTPPPFFGLGSPVEAPFDNMVIVGFDPEVVEWHERSVSDLVLAGWVTCVIAIGLFTIGCVGLCIAERERKPAQRPAVPLQPVEQAVAAPAFVVAPNDANAGHQKPEFLASNVGW